MKHRFLTFAALAFTSVAAYGQVVSTASGVGDTGFHVRYASNLTIGDSVINFTNSGASSTSSGIAVGNGGAAQNGNICASVYAYSPDEQLVSCCSCNVTPNGLNSLSVKNDLAVNPLTPIVPSALVIKILATAPVAPATCSNTTAATVTAGQLAKGLVAWGTTIHALPAAGGATPYGVTETEFANADLSQAELDRMTQLCAFIRANGSGYGICKSCAVGGLGASAK
jgi:hypothetical protein